MKGRYHPVGEIKNQMHQITAKENTVECFLKMEGVLRCKIYVYVYDS